MRSATGDDHQCNDVLVPTFLACIAPGPLDPLGAGLDQAPLSGYQLAFRIGAGCGVVALAAAVVWVRAPRRADEVSEPAVRAKTASS